MYRRGLKDHVKDELTRLSNACDINDLSDLIKEAIKIDNSWYDRAMEKKYDGGISGYSGMARSDFRYENRNRTPKRDAYGPMPMELDAIDRKKRQFRGKK